MKYLKLFESFNDNKTILIRSKADRSFRYDVSFNNDNKIVKVESQGDIADKISDKLWFNFITKLTTNTVLDYDQLRALLGEIPELYVDDII